MKNSLFDPHRERFMGPDWKLMAVLSGIIAVAIFVTQKFEPKPAENNITPKIEELSKPVIVIKYGSAAQKTIDSIELHRKISHDHVDNLYDAELQNVLDTTFNE